jgi:ABC-type transport system substrate-binding protein
MMRSLLLCAGVASVAAQGTTLTINVGTQKGSFKTGDDVGELNAHDYRPGEFVTNDFIYEGLTEWDGDHPAGVDGIIGTDDDYVKPSLATSWITNYDEVVAGTSTRYEIDHVHPPLRRHLPRWPAVERCRVQDELRPYNGWQRRRTAT